MMRVGLLAVAIAGCRTKTAPPPAPLGTVTPDVLERFTRTCPGKIVRDRLTSESSVVTCRDPTDVSGPAYSLSYSEREVTIRVIEIRRMHSEAELAATFERALLPLLPPGSVDSLRASLYTMPPKGELPSLHVTVMWSDGDGTDAKGIRWEAPRRWNTPDDE